LNLKDGDKVTLDGVEMGVKEFPPDGYWLAETGSGSYYYMMYKSKKELEELYSAGRLVLGTRPKRESGDGTCFSHRWKKYVGIREVYNYCDVCGEKEFKDWRLIKDEKSY